MNFTRNEDLILGALKSALKQATLIKITEKPIDGDISNFTSDIVNVTVEYEENEKFNLKHFILKIPAFNCPAFTFCKNLNLYNREAKAYEDILPSINKLLDTRATPLHYHTTDSKIFILENLIPQGYVSAPGSEFLSNVEFYPLLETLAKFHAASHLVHRRHPHLAKDDLFKDARAIEGMQILIDEWQPTLSELLRRKNASHLVPKLEATLSVIKSQENGLNHKINSENFKFVVFNHGDYRRENLLMKYVDQRVADIKMVDFQLSFWSTPVFDFLYCLIMSVQIDVIQDDFDNFVDAYLQYLVDALERLGSAETYTKTDFMADLEKIKSSMTLALVSLCYILFGSISKSNRDLFGPDVEMQTKIPHYECLEDKEFVRIVFYWLQYFDKEGALNDS